MGSHTSDDAHALFCSVLSNRVDQHNYNKYINACIVIGLHSRSSLNDPRELLVTTVGCTETRDDPPTRGVMIWSLEKTLLLIEEEKVKRVVMPFLAGLPLEEEKILKSDETPKLEEVWTQID